MMNIDKCILFDIKLDSDNFEVYKFKSEENLMLGLNLNKSFTTTNASNIIDLDALRLNIISVQLLTADKYIKH